jgi:hypothetical protein
VLERSSVGLDENFFDVGGNSINLVEIHAGLQRLVGRPFSIVELFSHSTVRSLADHFSQLPAGDRPPSSALRAERQRAALSARRQMQRRSRPG